MDDKLFRGIVDGIINGSKRIYNPTYFYGEKQNVADLISDLVIAYRAAHPGNNIIWTNGDSFLKETIRSIKAGDLFFRNRFHNCDLLVFERVEAIAGRNATMIEFYEIFDYIFMYGGQLVITGSVSPSQINCLDDRVRTQLESGIVFYID